MEQLAKSFKRNQQTGAGSDPQPGKKDEDSFNVQISAKRRRAPRNAICTPLALSLTGSSVRVIGAPIESSTLAHVWRVRSARPRAAAWAQATSARRVRPALCRGRSVVLGEPLGTRARQPPPIRGSAARSQKPRRGRASTPQPTRRGFSGGVIRANTRDRHVAEALAPRSGARADGCAERSAAALAPRSGAQADASAELSAAALAS